MHIYQDIILELLIDTHVINFQLSRKRCKYICEEKLEMMSRYIEQGNAIVMGAIENKMLIGFLWLHKHIFLGERRIHVNQIVVSNQFRGRGIGKQLMQETERQAKRSGIEMIDLFVSEVNVGALNMYKNLDFETERRYMKKKLQVK